MEKPPKRGPNRREFLKFGGALVGAAGIAADIAAGNTDHAGEKTANLAERAKSISMIETPHASYKIEYTDHELMSSPETLDGADALILECVAPYSSKEEVIELVNEIGWDRGQSWKPYVEIVQRALRDRVPIYFADRSYARPGEESILMSYNRAKFGKLGETAVGVGLMAGIDSNPEMSRRGFLANSAKAAAGAYLLAPETQDTFGHLSNDFDASTPDEHGLPREAQKALGAMNESIHPEFKTDAVDLRNALIAQKAETISQELERELGRKPVIAIEIGGEHFGIEAELLKAPAERVAYLRERLGDFLPLESTIARVVSKPNAALDIHITRDPALVA